MSETLWRPASLVSVEDVTGDLPPAGTDTPYTVYTRQGRPVAVARAGQPACRPLLVGPAAAAEGDEEALQQTIAAFSHFHARYQAPAVPLVDESGAALPRVVPGETLQELTVAVLAGDTQAKVFKAHSLRAESYTRLGGDVALIPVTVYVCPDDPDETDAWWVPAQAGQPLPKCVVHGKPLVPRRLGAPPGDSGDVQ